MGRVAEIVESEYEAFKGEILRTVSAKLAGAGVQFTELDLEAFYNAAWQSLYLKLRSGEEVANRKGFLVTVTYRQALGEHRAGYRQQLTDGQVIDPIAVDADLEADLDSRRQLRELREGLQMRLSARELQAATLCYFQGYSRPEAASVLDISPRRMEKVMDRVSREVRRLAGPIRADRWCDEADSLIRAYAAGILSSDGDRYQLARDHLDDCPACRHKVLLLRGLIAVGPPLPLAALLASGLAGGAKGAGAAAAAGEKGTALSAGAGGSASGVSAGAITVAAVTAVVAVAAVGVVASGAFGDPDPQKGEERSAPLSRVGNGDGASNRSSMKRGSADKSTPPADARKSQQRPEPRPVEQPPSEAPRPVERPAVVPAPNPQSAAQPEPTPPPASVEPIESEEDRAVEPRAEPPLRDAAIEFELR